MKYCINCRYYINSDYINSGCNFVFAGYQPRNPHQCSHPNNIWTEHNAIEPKSKIRQFADEINKNNTCKWYQRIRYKFWIKGDK